MAITYNNEKDNFNYEKDVTKLRNSILFLGILFIVSFFFPLIEYNEVLLLNTSIFAEKYRDVPKLFFVLPIIYGIVLIVIHRIFEIKKTIKILVIMAIVGALILASQGVPDILFEIQPDFFLASLYRIFQDVLFTISLTVIYIGGLNPGKDSKGKIAGFISLAGCILFIIYLFIQDSTPLVYWINYLPHYINNNIDWLYFHYEFPIVLINYNFIVSAISLISIFVTIILVVYNSINTWNTKKSLDKIKIANSTKRNFLIVFLIMFLVPFTFIADIALNGGKIQSDWFIHIITIFFKYLLLFIPYTLLMLIAFGNLYKFFVPNEIIWFDNFIKKHTTSSK